MKKSYLLLAGLALMSAFTACSNEDEMKAVAQAEGTPLVIESVGVAEVSTKAGILGTSFANGAQLGIFLNNGNLGSAYNANGETSVTTNVSYTKGESNWAWGSAIMLSSTAGTVRAYYPYNSEYTGTGVDVPVNVSATQTGISSGNDATDYMYADPVAGISNKTNTVATLTMKHALAMVTFKFKNDGTTPYVGAGNVQSIKLFNGNNNVILTGSATMNINNGTITIPEGASTGGITTELTGDAQALKNETVAAELPHLLVYPYSRTDGLEVGKNGFAAGDVKTTIKVDDANYTFELPGIEGGYQAGKNYVYEFTLTGTQLLIENVAIANWGEVPQTGGTIKNPDNE